MKIIRIQSTNNNATPIVIKHLNDAKKEKNVELFFEKGEYHFYEEGAFEQFIAVTNNCSGIKKINFPITDFDGITVNGNDSVFIFHDITVPFYVFDSKNVIIKNIVFDRAYSPIVNMCVKEKDDTGFVLKIDKNKSPYCIKSGNILFNREWGELSTAQRKLDLHMKDQHLVQYLFAGDCSESAKNLPASFLLTDASEASGGVYFKYRNNTDTKCIYEQGTEVYCLADGSGRESDVIILSNSANFKAENIVFRRGLGMGIIGQLSSDIEIENIRTDKEHYNENSTLTADCMHFVNCSGNIDIHDCDIGYISDDVINIHGVYTSLKEKRENSLTVELKHRDQRFFNPYKPGDAIDIIDIKSYETVSRFIVESSKIIGDDGRLIEICGSFSSGSSAAKGGFLVENPKRMPDVNIHNNKFRHFPSMRVSGGGKITIKDNEFSHCMCALQAVDLAGYWMESGRINDLTFKNNKMDNCTVSGKGSFIVIGIDDIKDDDAVKVHENIEISDNEFYNIADMAIKAGGTKNLVIKNNIYHTEKEDIIYLDGKTIPRR